jgi:glycosyltransferase involved in cell wall biosynthesis
MVNSETRRIAVFSYGLPVPAQKRGGIETVAHDLAAGLARRGHDVTVFTHDVNANKHGYDTRLLPWKSFVDSWLGRRLTMGLLGNVLALLPDYRNYDLIIAHGDSLLLPLAGKPIIRVMHGSAWCEAVHSSSPLRFAAQLLVYVQELATALTQKGCVAVSKNTLKYNPFIKRVIANGVDPSRFHQSGQPKTLEPSILFVGSRYGRKRGQKLIDWFVADIRPKHPAAELHMVMEPGPDLPGISYYTGISNEELGRLYMTAWVFASPSTYEGFGLPYVEAMASGTPVIATPNPGSREILAEGEYGVLANDDQFSAAVLELLSDSNRRQRLIEQGLQRAREYSLDRTLDQYEILIKEVCGLRSEIPQRA